MPPCVGCALTVMVSWRFEPGGGRAGFCDTEVEYLGRAVRAHFDVGRLQVAMHDAAFVRGVEGVGHLARNPSRFVERDRAVHETVGKGRAFDELEHERSRLPADVGWTVVNAVDSADVLVIQRREQESFAFEAGEAIGIACEGVRQDLDGDVAAERGIASAIDLAHTPRPETAGDLERSYARPECQCHSRGDWSVAAQSPPG